MAEYAGALINYQFNNGVNTLMARENNSEWEACMEACRYNCQKIYEQTGEYPRGCDDLETRCGCAQYNNGGGGNGNPNPGNNTVRCKKNVLDYIALNLKFEPVMNACEVYNYIKANFNCVNNPDVITDPEIPGDIGDDWVDNGGNTNAPPQETYDESLRKPIWWYHTDHLGSSTYLTDNFGRPSHYYETTVWGDDGRAQSER